MSDSTTANYSSIADIKKNWLNNIAPNYMDLTKQNNYQVGLFGYCNEVMGNSVEDGFNAITAARQEFYPSFSQNIQSLYKMATLQKVSLPVVTPASAKAILVIPEKEIIDKSTYNNGIYTCVIDNSLSIMADTIPFMLDYPIVIISKQSGNTWSHIAHYDTTLTNPLSTSNEKYLMTRTVNEGGTYYLFLKVTLHQVQLENKNQLITTNTNIEIVSFEVSFDGNLADFEVFYKESSGSTEIQLKKILDGSSAVQAPYFYYKMLDSNTIQIILPKNSYFTPALSSELRIAIYTSEGKNGEFDSFTNDLVCTANSENYLYNNTMTITGKISGSSSGGADRPTDDEFKQNVIAAYATNNTFSTSNDLQVFFNKIATDNTKMVFNKKRDDALIRLFGAYCLLKDTSSNVIATNTINLTLNYQQFSEYYSETKKALLRPGMLFEYGANGSDGTINYVCQKVTDKVLSNDLSIYDDNSRFIFTNPFLVSIDLNNDIIGYYLNSINVTKAITYEYVNDNTIVQFLGSSLTIKRNAMLGENFYKFSIIISPSSTDLDSTTIVTPTDTTLEANIIRATKAGSITSIAYDTTDKVVYANIAYSDNTTAKIQIGNYMIKNTDETFACKQGYTLNFNVYDTFLANDILATKNDLDLGKLRVCGDLNNELVGNSQYIPFFLQKYDSNTKAYTFAAYVYTEDTLSSNEKISLENIYSASTGIADSSVSIEMNDLKMNINVFYKNDTVNYSNAYSSFLYFSGYTLTNTYSQDDEDEFSLIQQIDFIRSTLTFLDPVTINSVSVNQIQIKEMPVTKANWVKDSDNYSLLINTIYAEYQKLYAANEYLENNFSIDFKFFNTYGKSRFYKVGIGNNTSILNSVNCSFKFGIYLTSLSSSTVFMTKFRAYVKNYIESINDVTSAGQSIYIMNMLADIKNNFSEIGYIEYYGFNSYDHGAQKIESLSDSEMTSDQKTNYIPEFVNIYSVKENGVSVPDISVTFLNS